jgi:hypothetical protein
MGCSHPAKSWGATDSALSRARAAREAQTLQSVGLVLL